MGRWSWLGVEGGGGVEARVEGGMTKTGRAHYRRTW
jgi:hypothetical protein